MKKTSKSLLYASVLIFIVGILLALCSVLYMKISTDDNVISEVTKESSITKTVSSLANSSPNSNYFLGLSDKFYRNVEIKLFSGNIEVHSTNDPSYIELSGFNNENIDYSIEADTVKIVEEDPVYPLFLKIDDDGIHYNGLKSLFTAENKAMPNQTIAIYINKDDAVQNISLKVQDGNILVEDIHSNEANLKSYYGSINIKNTVFTSKLNITSQFSSIDLQNVLYQTSSVNTKFGKVNISVPEFSENINTVISTWLGLVKIKTDVPTSYFKIVASTFLGKSSLNGESLGKKIEKNSNSNSRISVSSYVGNIEIDFSGEDELLFVPKIDKNDNDHSIETEPLTEENEKITIED